MWILFNWCENKTVISIFCKSKQILSRLGYDCDQDWIVSTSQIDSGYGYSLLNIIFKTQKHRIRIIAHSCYLGLQWILDCLISNQHIFRVIRFKSNRISNASKFESTLILYYFRSTLNQFNYSNLICSCYIQRKKRVDKIINIVCVGDLWLMGKDINIALFASCSAFFTLLFVHYMKQNLLCQYLYSWLILQVKQCCCS